MTEKELSAVRQKVDAVVSRELGLTPERAIAVGSTKPASREQIVAAFHSLYRKAKPVFSIHPAPGTWQSTSRISIGPSAKPALTELVRWGFVAPVGPLAVGPKSGLEPKQFGNAVGYFLSRLAELTHRPSAKFSPYLTEGATDPPSGKLKSR